jgi:hypothetical protein
MQSKHATLLAALALFLGMANGCSSSSDCGKCVDLCEVRATTPVAWSAPTPLGSAEQVFAAFAGTCQAPFQWDASGWGNTLTVVPAKGSSTVTATVALDPASARLLARTCGDALEIDGLASVELPEGSIARQQPFTVSASAASAPVALSFAVKEADFGPWVSIQKSDPRSTLSMSVSITALAHACSGTVRLGTEVVNGNMGSGASGPLGSWSDTGCGVGTIGVSLAEPWQGIDVAGAIAASLDQATLSGTWNDGAATTLALAVAPATTVVCAETFSTGMAVLTVPVNVAATSADGRVRELAGAGSVRVSVNQGTLWNLELNLSTDLACATQADVLPYTSASCTTASKVTAQLHFNRYPNGLSADGGSLELYVYDRQSATAGTGAADRVDRLTLAP